MKRFERAQYYQMQARRSMSVAARFLRYAPASSPITLLTSPPLLPAAPSCPCVPTASTSWPALLRTHRNRSRNSMDALEVLPPTLTCLTQCTKATTPARLAAALSSLALPACLTIKPHRTPSAAVP